MSLTIKNLENCFYKAIDEGYRFVAVVVKMEGFPSEEVIINEYSNFVKKLEYYKSAYNEDLTHRFSEGISIVGFTYADTFEDIELDLFWDGE